MNDTIAYQEVQFTFETLFDSKYLIMIPKFNISTKFVQHVYQPSEDTYFLLNTLDTVRKQLTSINPCIVLDLGTGTGIIGTYLSKLLNETTPFIISSDISMTSASTASNTLTINRVSHDVLCCDLIRALDLTLIDLIIFNTPYVKCDGCCTCTKNKQEYNQITESNGDISLSWCGGDTGNNPLYSLLNYIRTNSGKIKTQKTLIVLLEQFQSFKAFIESDNYQSYYKYEVLNKKRIFNENLFVIKVTFNSLLTI